MTYSSSRTRVEEALAWAESVDQLLQCKSKLPSVRPSPSYLPLTSLLSPRPSPLSAAAGFRSASGASHGASERRECGSRGGKERVTPVLTLGAAEQEARWEPRLPILFQNASGADGSRRGAERCFAVSRSIFPLPSSSFLSLSPPSNYILWK